MIKLVENDDQILHLFFLGTKCNSSYFGHIEFIDGLRVFKEFKMDFVEMKIFQPRYKVGQEFLRFLRIAIQKKFKLKRYSMLECKNHFIIGFARIKNK